MTIPSELSYTAEHEWVRGEDVVTVGITAYAADQLGDVVFVQLPEAGAEVSAGEPCGEVESTKSVSDVYSPVTGEITDVNPAVTDDPSLLNSDPYGEGWLFKVRVTEEPGDLLDADAYAKLTEGSES
ncbi:glycine cleavage system protein GcvH [Bailinhaonella thermotolerans]|uniref:Glycine cleavage system H protein n=1 Tax=Bailinhaonella thermotolerans TaxID=1070861 RepID=A0A3A4AUK9_9ACTN|nr:glycine cleavage system protein GcvH [Bailinhaonella thermotolerans]RJL32391.1 glycine cleavage system protein GcvH [Bailinhaonella thermotolerans]